ncbi:MAG: hypothetical protein ABI600_13810, partial [Luteolibacter sp.]
GRGVTFWISPLKWLGHHGDQHSLDTFVTLTEEIMGWQGKVVSDNAGGGLGRWLKWLRSSSKTATLSEAREMLSATTAMEPPTPSKNLVRTATARPAIPMQSVKTPRRKSINGTVVTIVLLCLIAGGLGAWAFYRKDPNEPKIHGGLAELAAEVSKGSAKKTPRASEAAPANRLSKEMREVAAAMNEDTAKPADIEKPSPPVVAKSEPVEDKKPESVAEIVTTPSKDPGIFSPDDT